MYRILLLVTLAPALFSAGFQSSDLLKLRSVGSVQFSPDGSRIAYTITRNDLPAPPDRAALDHDHCRRKIDLPERRRRAIRESRMVAGREMDRLFRPAGRKIRPHRALGRMAATKKYLGPLEGTNAPLPTTGKTMTWSPDGKQIAYVSAQPGPETADATGDPIVITRYLYKPTAAEGNSALQRQQAPAHFRGRCRERQIPPAHQRHALRAFHRMVARRTTDRLRLQSRAERRSVLQLRSC